MPSSTSDNLIYAPRVPHYQRNSIGFCAWPSSHHRDEAIAKCLSLMAGTLVGVLFLRAATLLLLVGIH